MLAKTNRLNVSWEVSFGYLQVNLKPGQDAVFHFSLYQPGQTSWDSTSQNFNITNTEYKGTTTSAVTTSAPTSTRSDEGSSTDAVTSTTTSTSTSTSTPDSGLSTGAIAGIAIGATLGGLLVLGALGFFAWKHFRKPTPPPIPEVDGQGQQRAELENKPPAMYTPQSYNYSPVPNQQPHYNPSPGLYEAP